MARKYRSLLDYFQKVYEPKIKKHMLNYFQEHNLYATEDEYENPSFYGFAIDTEVSIIKVKFFDSPDYSLDFDIVVYCETEVTTKVGDESETLLYDDYFTLTMSGYLFNGFRNLRILEIKRGSVCRPFEYGKSLNEFLVPYIKKDQYNDYAERFLKQYFPEALKEPVYAAPPTIIEKMNLDVRFGPLPDNCFGKTIFAPETVQIWNFSKHELESFSAPMGTIIINYNIIDQKGFGGLNFVAIHECMHWFLHRKYFELMKVLNPDLTSMCCENDIDRETTELELRNKYFMENQANAVAACVLMPAVTAKHYFDSVLSKVRKDYHLKKEALYNKALSVFTNHFGVSITSAKYRLRDLGYTPMASLISVDDNVKIYNSSVKLMPGETYDIERDALAKLISENELFRQWITSGVLIYVDKKVAINSSEYVKTYKKKYGTRLTAKALRDVSKCCILFNVVRFADTITYNPEIFNTIMFFSGGYTTHKTEKTSIDLKSSHNIEICRNAKNSPAAISLNEATRKYHELKTMHSFAEKFDYIITDVINNDNLSERAIAKKANIGASSISDYRDGISQPKQKTLFAICAAIKLHPILARHLFDSLHYRYDYDPEIPTPYDLYCFLSQTLYEEGLDAWNNIITECFPGELGVKLP